MTAPAPTDSRRERRPPRSLVGLLTVTLAVAAAAILPLFRPTGWAASVVAQLQPAELRAVTPYVDDVLSRTGVVATYAAILADPRFLREAGEALALSSARVASARVNVRQEGGSALLRVTVTTARRADAAALAPALVDAAVRYVEGLRPLYVLAPLHSPGSLVDLRRLSRYGASTGALIAVSLLPAGLLSWWLLSALPASRRPSAG